MIIKKIFIKNFKGIRETKIIEFSDKNNIMIGPNGFGKTTVYDVIELCLTGKLQRIISNQNVTSDNKDYDKFIFQNDIKEDTVIKVLLCNNKDEEKVITKFFDKNNKGSGTGRKFKPNDFKLFKTFFEDSSKFDNVNYSTLEQNEDIYKEIGKFFDIDSISIEKTYNLFNYIQQEENTFFLKMTEKERKGSFSHLVDTSKYIEEDKKITDVINISRKHIKSINTELEKIENNKVDKVEYIKLLSKDFEFDKEELFNKSIDVNIANKEKYTIELEEIKKVQEYFNYDEFVKNNKSIENNTKIEKILLSQHSINYLLLQNYLKDEIFQKISFFYDVNNGDLINAIVVKDLISNKEALYEIKDKYEKAQKYLKLNDFDKQINFIKDNYNFKSEDDKSEYLHKLDELKKNKETASELQKIINNTLQKRDELKKEFDKLEKEKEICPFCGKDWTNYEQLTIHFDNSGKKLKELLDKENNQLLNLQKHIKQHYINVVEKECKEFLSKTKFDTNVCKYIEDFSFAFEEEKYNKLVSYGYQFNKLDLNVTYEEIHKNSNQLREFINVNLHVDNEIYKLLEELVSEEIAVDEISDIIGDEKNKFIISIAGDTMLRSNILKNNRESLKRCLKEKKSIVVEDKEILKLFTDFRKYFKDNDELIKNKDADLISKKESYINYRYSLSCDEKREELKKKLEKLSNIEKNLDKTKRIMKSCTENFEKDIFEKLKIRFYIYTAKILQNYQQGLGIFIKKNNSDFRFVTDGNSLHDVTHMLSSGQLSVVSLAFSLAINKAYNISEELKFLFIDDPVEDLDVINLHSLVELLRYEFLDDYQFILSTHNDNIALFLAYKFNKFLSEEEDTKLLNIREQFFGNSETE